MLLHKTTGTIYGLAIDFTMHQCGGCGIHFCVPTQWWQKKQDNNGSFNCPNGCKRAFIGPTKEQKLRDQLEEVKRKAEQDSINQTNRLLDEINKGKKLKREIKRVKNGVCPVAGCKRSFHSLHGHLANEHPTYTGKPAPKRKKN